MIKNPQDFFRRLGANVRDKYREHVFGQAKDVYGRPFKNYSKGYSSRKRAGSFKRQAQNYASSKAPVLTSDLLRDLTLVKATRDGFEIGWVSQGAKIEWLKKNGRKLTTKDKPFPDKLVTYMNNELSRQWKKENPNKTTVHRVGKKK
tara:strand:+ start:10136 stop:10576 length:441 start_codon:yes stop_codon:yes gene_type:complete